MTTAITLILAGLTAYALVAGELWSLSARHSREAIRWYAAGNKTAGDLELERGRQLRRIADRMTLDLRKGHGR
jgi:hypothetical protein